MTDRTGTTVTPELLAAYEATDYAIAADPGAVARPGVPSVEVDALLSRFGVRTAAVLTAWNPLSQTTPPAENAAAQARLVARLRAEGLPTLPAEGRGRDGTWPPEESLCILGIEMEAAHRMAGDFRQAAFLWLETGLPPRVVLTRRA
ncbi:MAG: DUF3293 domain-containing protein [Pseudomonadota bacterium]